jgi:hypothetical protein
VHFCVPADLAFRTSPRQPVLSVTRDEQFNAVASPAVKIENNRRIEGLEGEKRQSRIADIERNRVDYLLIAGS